MKTLCDGRDNTAAFENRCSLRALLNISLDHFVYIYIYIYIYKRVAHMKDNSFE